MKRLFYRPERGVAADFIPFCENGVFYLFYLQDYRDRMHCGEGTPWYLITTKDFVSFEEHGEVLPRGTMDDQDLYVFTGSVSKYAGQYHIWYTGHNPYYPQKGLPQEAIMHAVSEDLFHWHKIPQDTFYAPTGYEQNDWRDPFVFADGSNLRMLLAARSSCGADRYRGLTAQCISSDGVRWEIADPFWAPELYFTHECPDLFRIGEWYYLLFSEFSQDKVTRYRMSRSLTGPWLAPPDDRFDGCAYYAAKTAALGTRRYLFGWLATREGDSDNGAWQWGGCLVVHELVQRQDGTLAVRIPEFVHKATRMKALNEPRTIDGLLCQGRVNYGALEDVSILDLLIGCDDRSGSISVALFADEHLQEGTFVRLDLSRRRMVIDRWPREAHRVFEPGLERPIPRWDPNGMRLTILIDGTAACAYLDGEEALCFRIYRRSGSQWGILADGVKATIQCYQ